MPSRSLLLTLLHTKKAFTSSFLIVAVAVSSIAPLAVNSFVPVSHRFSTRANFHCPNHKKFDKKSNPEKMGLLVSLFQSPPPKEPSKKDRSAAWKKKVETFQDQVLNPDLYVQHPVRANTIEAADEYPGTLGKSLLPGTHKHLGGAFDPADGCIYGVPASAKAVLVLYPKKVGATTPGGELEDVQKLKLDIHAEKDLDKSQITYGMTSIPLPESVASTKMKWLRGIFQNGYMYAIPAWANAILCVDVDAFWGRRPNADRSDVIKLIPLPDEHPEGMQWQWHGAGINQEKTAIYCIPSNAQQVLKVDLLTNTSSLLPIEFDEKKYKNFRIDLSNKFYGGIRGVDNAIYGVPYRAPATLRIDCNTDKVTLVGPDFGVAGYRWHGGIMVNGIIYAHTSHADYTVLCIDTNKGGHCYEIPIERAPYDTNERTNYKWLGGSLGADGNIYCPACDVSAALKIDVTTNKCTTFGFAGEIKNKWQGGVLGNDGCVYCIPASGVQVLRIATFPGAGDNEKGENPMQLLGDLPKHKDKWQGGHVGVDGNLYFIPENGYRVLKVITPQTAPKLVDGKLPEGDVTIEML